MSLWPSFSFSPGEHTALVPQTSKLRLRALSTTETLNAVSRGHVNTSDKVMYEDVLENKAKHTVNATVLNIQYL